MNKGSGTFTIPLGPDQNSRHADLHIVEKAGITADNLPLSTWGASLVLAKNLHKIPLPPPPMPQTQAQTHSQSQSPRPRVLELGAGTGLAGLAAAAVWRASAVLTDLPPIVRGLEANIAPNAALLTRLGGGAEAQSGELDWREPRLLRLPGTGEVVEASEENGFDVIVAADCCYDEEQPGLEVGVVRAWLRRGQGARVVFCYPLRVAYLDHVRELWARMEAAGFECLGEGREEGREESLGLDEEAPIEWCVFGWKKGRG